MGRVSSFWDDYGFAKETLGSLMLREHSEGEEHWWEERKERTLGPGIQWDYLLKVRTDHERRSILDQFPEPERSKLLDILRGVAGGNPLYARTAEIAYLKLWRTFPKVFWYYEGTGYKVAYSQSPHVPISSKGRRGFVTYVHAVRKVEGEG